MANETKIPLVLTLAERDLSIAFKPLLKELIKGKSAKQERITNTSLNVGIQIRKDLIHGFQDVDLDSYVNNKALDDLVDDLWLKFKQDLLLNLRKYNKDFNKKSGKVA